ncbi:hypothetical protein AB0M20_25840 [Actinoplanes sp. NPDC051633]|uniref:caspase family protein n=1 Tax=Actinoplanes sp. NPDC051633 TaxID=3155670 RepID=UPI003449741D
MIYYSGHGITANNGSLLMCARNTRTDRRLTTAVSAETITRMIDHSAAAITIIILDCCYAGAFKTGDVAAELGGRGRYVLAATRSHDRAPDAEHGTGYSRFTAHLLQGLQGAAAQPDAEFVTVSDLYHYLRRRMAEDGPFIPQRRFDGDSDPVLARIGPERHHDTAVPGAVAGTGSQPASATPEGAPRPQRRRRRAIVTSAAVAATALALTALVAAGLPGRWHADGPAGTGGPTDTPTPVASAGTDPPNSVAPSPPMAGPASTRPPSGRQGAPVVPTTPATLTPSSKAKKSPAQSGTISSLRAGAKVRNCEYFSGTSHLAAGQSLILVIYTNSDPQKYAQQVINWDKPQTLNSWRGIQWFGSASPGDRYSVELMAVDLETSRAVKDADADVAANNLVPRATPLAIIEVEKTDGDPDNSCPWQ